jgi:uncharacterized protein YoxC
MTAEQTLVIILAIALAVFLVLAIVLVIYLIIIASKVKKVVTMAERTVDHVESMVSNVQRAVAPAAIGNALVDMVNRFMNKGKGK